MPDWNQLNQWCDQAYAAYQAGNRLLASQLAGAILESSPDHSRALYLQGVLHQEDGRLALAIEFIGKACQADPSNGVYANALGELHRSAGEREKALEWFQKSVSIQTNYARAWNNLGLLSHEAGDLKQATRYFQNAVSLNPSYAIAWNNLGAVCQKKKDHQAAAQCFQKAIQINPSYPEACLNLGISFFELGRSEDAAGLFQKAIDLRPAYDKAHFHFGLLLQKFRNDYKALEHFQKAVELNPNNDEYARTLGDHLLVKKDWALAICALEKALELNPGNPHNLARLFHARQLVCNWDSYHQTVDELWRKCEVEIQEGKPTSVGPFQSLTMPWSLSQLRQIARHHSNAYRALPGISQKTDLQNPRLRIGYVSGDLYDHAVGHLLHGFFEKHDRSRFEVFVYTFSPADGSVYRKRIEQGAEHFVDVSALDSRQLAQKIAGDGIQILVDLMGYTGVHRTEAFAQRPAPLQISFLGMLGTMGATFMDYLVADPHIVSSEMEMDFDEKLIRMPHSYLIAQLMEPGPKSTREDHRLPPGKFVFCSFNNSYKIEPFTFDCWMNILGQVPESVLWLSSSGEIIENNLRANAAYRGVAPERIIFAPFAKCDAHIERQSHADLFLDTFIYNAAATGSMALQAGLPILTMQGKTFASRVGRSLLNAVGLQELVNYSPEEYITRAVELAKDGKQLGRLRFRLQTSRDTAPLFDTSRFVLNFEKALEMIWERQLSGEAPFTISVRE